MTIEIAGMAHVQLTVDDLERAKEFYEKLLGYLGMRPVRPATHRAAPPVLPRPLARRHRRAPRLPGARWRGGRGGRAAGRQAAEGAGWINRYSR